MRNNYKLESLSSRQKEIVLDMEKIWNFKNGAEYSISIGIGGSKIHVLDSELNGTEYKTFKDFIIEWYDTIECDFLEHGYDYVTKEELKEFKNIVNNFLIVKRFLEDVKLIREESAIDIRAEILMEESELYSGYYMVLQEDMTVVDVELLKDYDRVYQYGNVVIGFRYH